MSVEDLNSDFPSDESDYEAEQSLGDSENDDNDEASYSALVSLHNSLMCFEHIYANNVMLDMQQNEDEAWWSNFDSDSVSSELPLIRDFIDSVFEDVFSANSSESYSADGSSSDAEDPGGSYMRDFVRLREELAPTSSSSSCSSAASEGTDGQTLNADNLDNRQD